MQLAVDRVCAQALAPLVSGAQFVGSTAAERYPLGIPDIPSVTPQFLNATKLVREYLESDDFWSLWRRIAGPEIDSVPVDQMEPSELDAFNEMYELVYMGQPDSANAADRRDGILGGAELRSSLVAWLDRYAK